MLIRGCICRESSLPFFISSTKLTGSHQVIRMAFARAYEAGVATFSHFQLY